MSPIPLVPIGFVVLLEEFDDKSYEWCELLAWRESQDDAIAYAEGCGVTASQRISVHQLNYDGTVAEVWDYEPPEASA
jgi:hypothetical protein